MEQFECPSGAIDCPYYKNGMCKMYEKEGCGPAGECDDYDYYHEGEDEDDED